jgi:hypothetical protein
VLNTGKLNPGETYRVTHNNGQQEVGRFVQSTGEGVEIEFSARGAVVRETITIPFAAITSIEPVEQSR